MKTTAHRLIASLALLGGCAAAHASLTTLPAGWPPAGSSGLEGVQFNVNSGGGVAVAVGAHAYKEGATMPNDGVSTFYAKTGTSPNPDTSYARWSLDYSIDYGRGHLGDYRTQFAFDIDPTAATNYFIFNLTGANADALLGPGGSDLSVLADSQNPVFFFAQLALLGSGFSFNPLAAGDFDFRVRVYEPDSETPLAGSAIKVRVANEVPEPASLALVGAALLGLAAARRRKA